MDRGSGSTGRWEYIDFELEIREGSRRRYPVSVRSPAGEAQEQMRFPFDELELENRLLVLENTLLRSGEGRRRIPSEEEQPVQEFGQSLLQALLRGELRTRYEMSWEQARRQNKGLRLKLRVHPPELARLPWEFLYDPDRDEYLSLSDKMPLVRYLDLPRPVEQLPVSPPLRILGMVASPSDLPELDVEHEKRLVEQAVIALRTSGLVELIWLEGQTWSDLQRAMWGGPWHIFHFIGHGVFDEASDEGCIALSDEAGCRRLLGARNLARLLDGHYPLRLVFLNSCEGAKGSARDAFSGAAATLVRRGLPAVVAMQYEVTDQAAIAFARTFYDAVANGLPVDAAVAAGRTAVSMDSALEWGTPVLYMRSPDGRIFDISAPVSRPESLPEEAKDREDEEQKPTEQMQHEDSKALDQQPDGPLEVSDVPTIPRPDAPHPASQPSEVCPYRGLDAFTEDDAKFFFGRQRVVDKLLSSLKSDLSLLAVFGPSGSGKSSVAQAGLVPQLQKGEVPGITRWGVIITRQYDDPFKQLEAAGLEGASEGLVDATGTWLEQHSEYERLLLILDQFEELLITCPEPLRQDFLRQLMELLDSAPLVTVVLVVQEGFYNRLVQQAPELAQYYWLPESWVEVPPDLRELTRDELINIVQEPANAVGLRFEEGLVERIADDAIEAAPAEGGDGVARSSVLPLLEYALTQLWERRQDGTLRREAYEGIGGLTGGLTLWANQAYRSLGKQLQPVARRILTDLVDPGDESQGVAASRRTSTLAELSRHENQSEAVQQVVQLLAKAHLLVTAGDRQSGQEYVEIIHDALLHEWKPLRRWLREEDRRYQAWRQELEGRAESWLESNPDAPTHRDEGELLRDDELAKAEGWLSKRGTDLSQLEREFVDASKEHDQQEAAREQYRTAVAEPWVDRRLDKAEAERLSKIANNRLKLSPNTAAEIEREVMGDTKEALLERQNRLEELYAQARRSYQVQDWQVVVSTFNQIHDLNPEYPDPEGLLASAHEQLEALEHKRTVATLYAQGQRHMEAGEWEQARECFEEVQHLEPGYRDTETLLSQVQEEFAKPPTIKVPDLGGKNASQANSALAGVGLKLGTQNKAPSRTIPKGKIIGQSPKAGTEVEAGSLMSITVSSGLPPVEVPGVTGQSPSEASSALAAAGLKLGGRRFAPNDSVPEGKIIKQNPAARTNAEPGSSVSITVSSGSTTRATTAGRSITASNADRIQLLRTLEGHTDIVASVAFSPGGRLLATGAYDNTVRLWQVKDGVLLRSLEGHTDDVSSVAFSPDGQLLASGSDDVRLWRVKDGALLRTLDGVVSVAFSPDGRLLATGAYDNTVQLWWVEDGALRRKQKGHTGLVISVAFSLDGRRLASGGVDDGTVRLWRVTDGKLLRTLEGHPREVFSVAFSPDGRLLASSSDDVWLWRVKDGVLLRNLEGHTHDVSSVAFSPDGQLLASGSDDVRLWRVKDGALLRTLDGVVSVAFSPDGRLLATGAYDNTVRLWCIA